MKTRKLDNIDRATVVLPDEGPVQAVDGASSTSVSESAGTVSAAGGVGRRLALNTAIVGGAFIISRILGLVREAVIAGQFGASDQIDAYKAAFNIPDTLFLLIIGGAVGSAFIPVFTSLLSKQHEREAWHLTSTLINASVVLLSVGGILLGFAAPLVVGTVLYPGGTAQQQEVIVNLTRIMLLSPLFLGLGGWAMGILNARQHFTLPALAPIFYNVAIIVSAIFLAPVMGVYGLAWGVVAGALLHFGVQVPGLLRAGMRYSMRLNLRDEGVGKVGKLILPRIMGQAAFQANIIVMSRIASFLVAGSLAAFNYAYMIMILPHGVFAMSLATVTFPTMSAQFAEGKLDAMRNTLARAVKVLIFLTVPSAVGMFLLRSELVASLFQLKAFGVDDTQRVASVLGYFAFGLVSYAVVEVITRAFYALQDTATPVVVSVVTVLINLGLATVLALGMGMNADGLALSLAITTSLELVLLWVLLGRKLPGWRLTSDNLLLSIGRSCAASLVMGLVLFFLLPALQLIFPSSGKLEAIVLLASGIVVGAGVYLIVARLLGSEEVEQATGLLLRRFRRA
ncbi:MAG: murein biosynthesis integral membrane protein MurJ [Chloroflexota bacterium]